MVAFEVGFGAEFGDDFSIHSHATFEDQLLGFAAGSDARAGKDFL
jgi:hypothetical protein